jgi:carboxyl-terminal processing protease
MQVLLDLRGNPGGGVLAAVDVASLFLPRAAVVFRTRGRSRTADEDYVTRMAGPFDDIPLIALIDERSASGAEALAGCLQDHDRALLIGRRSFGKALLQSPYALPYGDLLWLTTGRVLTPSGRFIQRHYAGLVREQYYGLAGRGGIEQDTTQVFRTDAGRAVRGGGGIRPDVEMPPPPSLPTWHAVAANAGLEEAVADSIAFTLPATEAARAAWTSSPERWGVEVLAPFLEQVRARLDVAAEPDTARDAVLARRLAERVALVRWGPEAQEDLRLNTDPSVRRALRVFPRLTALLAGPTK